VLGAPPGERAWRITLRDPSQADRAGDIIELRDYSFSVSGNYERFFKLGGKAYSHIMDPRSGGGLQEMTSCYRHKQRLLRNSGIIHSARR